MVHFSTGIKNILDGPLKVYGGEEGRQRFPADLPNEKARTTDLMSSPVEWLRSIAGKTKHPKQLAILENIAFTAEVSWKKEGSVRYVSEVHAQALILEGASVMDVLNSDASAKGQYLRVDFEPGNLGTVFPDPMVHVHSSMKGEPRFPLSESRSLPHIDFIEFILRNYARGTWNEWADRVWEQRVRGNLSSKPGEDYLVIIRSAFASNQYAMLCDELRGPVSQWKEALIQEKKAMSTLAYDADFDVLSY